jgi:hypothetical protein
VLAGADYNAVIRKVSNAAAPVKIYPEIMSGELVEIAATATNAASHQRQIITFFFV